MTEAYKKRAARIVASLKKALEINDCIIEKENALSIKFKKESLLNNKDIMYIAYADIDLSQHLLILYCPFTEPLNEKEGLNQLLNDFNSYTYDGEFSISNKIASYKMSIPFKDSLISDTVILDATSRFFSCISIAHLELMLFTVGSSDIDSCSQRFLKKSELARSFKIRDDKAYDKYLFCKEAIKSMGRKIENDSPAALLFTFNLNKDAQEYDASCIIDPENYAISFTTELKGDFGDNNDENGYRAALLLSKALKRGSYFLNFSRKILSSVEIPYDGCLLSSSIITSTVENWGECARLYENELEKLGKKEITFEDLYNKVYNISKK